MSYYRVKLREAFGVRKSSSCAFTRVWLAKRGFFIQPEFFIAVAIKRLKKAQEDLRTPNASRK